MNGYKVMADSYRQYLDSLTSGEDSELKTALNRSIKVNDFLAECDEQMINELFNSSAFNDILKGYVDIAVSELEDLTEGQRHNIRGKISALLDRVPAKEAKAYYYAH